MGAATPYRVNRSYSSDELLEESVLDKSVLIIGAGVAGLSAAHRLKSEGFEVTVLEAGGRIGGRASTDFFEDSLFDRGAQFLSDGYRNVCRLIDELGLRDDFRPSSQWNAIIKGGRGRAVSASRPWSVSSSGLLGMKDAMKLASGSRQMIKETEHLPLEDFSRWSDLDDAPASAWLRKQFNEEILEYVFEPMVHGFYFQEPDEMSRALPALLWNFGARNRQPMALFGGMESLPDALAAGLDIRLRTPVETIEAAEDGVTVEAGEGRFSASRLILAVPAPVARNLWTPDDEIERALLATPYSPAVVMGLLIPDGLPKSSMPPDVHGIMFPRRERRVLGSVVVVTRKCPIHVDQGELLNVMLSHADAMRLFEAPQDEIFAEVLSELEEYYPGLEERIDLVRVYRWRNAAACTPPGRCRNIQAYRSDSAEKKIFLAGDYMGTPNVEGAVESGLWAAGEVEKAVIGGV